ncbi:MAG: Rha family transcriptional regulator [Faecalibacterium prausnitzii]
MNDIILSTQNGEPVASSREVAKRFGKEHKHVLAAIRQILAAENSATKFFHETAFEYRGQRFPEYLMNRDGFALLAMGFTGKEAVTWKLKYIEAFNQMEKQLAAQHKDQQHIEQLEATNERLTAAIQAVSTAKEQLAEVTDLRNDFIKHRDDYKARFIQAKANYGKICDSLRQAESLVQRAQAELDSRIDQLKIVAFGLPAFDQIMADIFTTEKKE